MHLSPKYAKMIKVLQLKFCSYLPFPNSCYMFYSLHRQWLNRSNNIVGYNKASNSLYGQVSSNNVEILRFSQLCCWSVESSAKWRCAVWWDCLTLKKKENTMLRNVWNFSHNDKVSLLGMLESSPSTKLPLIWGEKF